MPPGLPFSQEPDESSLRQRLQISRTRRAGPTHRAGQRPGRRAALFAAPLRGCPLRGPPTIRSRLNIQDSFFFFGVKATVVRFKSEDRSGGRSQVTKLVPAALILHGDIQDSFFGVKAHRDCRLLHE